MLCLSGFELYSRWVPLNITTQRILLEKQAVWLIWQGWGKNEEVCKGMFSILCMHFFIAYQARIT